MNDGDIFVVVGGTGRSGKSALAVAIEQGVVAPGTTEAQFATWLSSSNAAAAASALAADGSADAAAADALATAADRVQTGLDRAAAEGAAASAEADAASILGAVSAAQTARTGAETARDAAATSAASVASPNILFDSFNQYTFDRQTLGGWTWYATAFPFTQASANIPVKTPVAQVPAGSAFDKNWDFTKLGLKAGDTMTVRALVWAATSGGIRVEMYFRRASDNAVLATVSPAYSAVAGLQVVEAQLVVPAGDIGKLLCRVQTTGAGNNSEVAAIVGSIGVVKPALAKSEPDLAYVLSWLNASNLDARFLAQTSATATAKAVADRATSGLEEVSTLGKNLFNPADPDVALGRYIESTNGIATVNAGYNATGFIPVVAGQTYVRSFAHQMAFYDINKAYISGLGSGAPAAFTPPAGATYVRCSIQLANYATFQVELGTTATIYEPYGRTIDTAALPTISGDKVADGTLPAKKAVFFLSSKNLFNPADPDYVAGSYVLFSTGNLAANASYSATGYIPVTAGATYSVSAQHQTAFYSAAKSYVSGINAGNPQTFTIPAGVAYMRCSVPAAALATYQVEAGASVTPWVAYGLTLDPAYLPPSVADTIDTVQDIMLPRKVHALVGAASPNIEQANLYFENILRGNRGDILVDCVASYGRQYNECWRIEAGNTGLTGYGISSGAFTLQVNVLNYKFAALLTASTAITLVSKAASTPVRLLAIGDSITRDGTFVKQVKDKLPVVTLQGIRHYSTDDAALNREGRGGWALATFFTNYALASGYDSPFMFPVGVSGANYRGNVVFWKKAINIASYPADNYDLDGFQKIARGWADSGAYLYDANGYPTSPTAGWVVYDPALAAGSRFQEWSGSAWVAMASQPGSWAFDFGKYLTRYAAAFADGLPTHLSFLLAANDFQGTTPTSVNLATWKGYIDALIASARAAVPGIKIILNLPVLGAEQDAWGMSQASGQTAERYRQNIQAVSRFLIDNYDSSAKEAEGTFVCAMGAFVDPDYGFDATTEAPNIYATGSTVKRQNNWVHPNTTVGHKQMGDALAAVVQATR